MRTITVQTAKAYQIEIGAGVLNTLGQRMNRICTGRTVMLVSDDHVFPLYGAAAVNSLTAAGYQVQTFVVAHGESSKNLSVYAQLLQAMCDSRMSRGDTAAALGGGVIGDLTGFAAATYQRGMDFVQIPTTLLAAVDASVGGKTAVNLPGGKNQAGCFYQPRLVLCDTDTLRTLPEVEYRCGCAEILKYAMLADASLLDSVLAKPVADAYEEIIARCVTIKRDYVEQDERDLGLRMQLNFGHTIGHAIEQCSGYAVPHGMAVAMGMAAITRAAVYMGVCESETQERLRAALAQYRLDTHIPYGASELYEAAMLDKKNTDDRMRIVVPERVGKCRIESIRRDEFRTWLRAGGLR